MSELTAGAVAPSVQGNQGSMESSGAPEGSGEPKGGQPDFEDTFIIDGQERKMKYSEAKRELQKREAAEKRFNDAHKLKTEANQTSQQARQIIEALQSKDRKLIEQVMGADGLHEFAEQLIWDKIQNAKKSPEQIEHEKTKERLQTFEEREKANEQEQQQQQLAQKVEHYKSHYSNMISKAIESSNLPKDATTVALMANILDTYRTHNYEPSTDELVSSAMERYNAPVKSYLPAMSGEQLVNYLGADIVKKIREFDLGQLRSPMRGQRQPQITQQQGSGNHEERTFISPSDLARMARKKAGLG